MTSHTYSYVDCFITGSTGVNSVSLGSGKLVTILVSFVSFLIKYLEQKLLTEEFKHLKLLKDRWAQGEWQGSERSHLNHTQQAERKLK